MIETSSLFNGSQKVLSEVAAFSDLRGYLIFSF